MTARTFISLMLILTVFLTAFFVFTNTPAQQQTASPAGNETVTDMQLQAGDGMIWQSVSRHLLTVVQ